MKTSIEPLIDALSERFDVFVTVKVPEERPSLFVRLDASSPKAVSPVVEETLIAVQVYGQDLEEVLALIQQIRFFLLDEIYSHAPDVIWWQEEAGPHDFPDPDIQPEHRWQLTGIISTPLV